MTKENRVWTKHYFYFCEVRNGSCGDTDDKIPRCSDCFEYKQWKKEQE